MFDLSTGPKKAVAISALAGLIVALATVADLIWAFPFAGMIGFDILFLLSAANVIYLAYDAYQDLVPRRRRHGKRSSPKPATNADRRAENESNDAARRTGPKDFARPIRHRAVSVMPGSSRF
jgi:hypothetical protein